MTVLSRRYELGEELGSGGMGRVVVAHDRVLDRRVAVKLVVDARADDDTARERLLREARAAATLQHPNVVTVFDVIDDDGRLHLVMELVEGMTLASLLQVSGPLPDGEAVRILSGILDGLTAAHERGFVHRDVKPSNVLISDSGVVKLTDFGIAKALDPSTTDLTLTGQVLGTPRYLAPELALEGTASPASDLYAVGVIAYEALSGRLPFEATTPMAMAIAHQREPVPPLTETSPDVNRELAAVVERALEKDPGQRFASASSMRDALHTAIGSIPSPVDASTPGPGTTLDHTPSVAAANATTMASTPVDPPLPHGRPVPWWAPWLREPRRRRALVVLAATLLVALALIAFARTGSDPSGAPEGVVGDIARPGIDEALTDGLHEEPDDESDEPPAEQAPDEPPNEDDPVSRIDQDALAAADSPEQLLRLLSADPTAAGPRGPDLVGALDQLLQGPEQRNRSRAANRLTENVRRWAADGELDPAVADRTIALIARYR